MPKKSTKIKPEELETEIEETQDVEDQSYKEEVKPVESEVEESTEDESEDKEEVDEEAIKNAMGEKEDEEEAKKAKGLEKLERAKRLLAYAKNARRKYDREWLSRDLFRRGYQFVSNNQRTGSITMSSKANSKIPVNLTWAFARSIKNQVTSFKPKWEVLPEFKGKKSESNARLAGKTLDHIFKINNLTKLVKDAVTQGLFFSVGGPFETYWDEDFDNGKNQPRGEVRIRLHDPYDIYFDPNATDLEEASFVIKAVRTDIDKIKTDPRYKDKIRDSVTGGTLKRAESEYKQFLIQTIQDSQQQTVDNETTILYELQEKTFDDDGNVKIEVLTWTNEIPEPLRFETIDQEYYDMEIFQADMNPLEMYGESWSRHVIAMNRVYNALESSMFDYHYRFAKGRLVIDKNSGVRAIVNEHGSIIEKNRGAEVKGLPITPLPSSFEQQLARTRTNMEDIAGVHDATLGRVPSAIKSGIGIAELKQSDSTNQDDLVQNLEECLMRLGDKVLKKVAKHYDTPRVKKVVGTGRLVEHFAVVGEGFIAEDKEKWTIGEEKYPLAQIAYNNELSVSIGSWLAYTKEGRQKVLLDMAEAGLIDKETVLKYFEFPDIQDIVDKTRVEALVEMKRKEAPEMPSGISQEQLALAENEMLMEGSPVPVDPETDDHELHIAIHTSIIEDENKKQIMSHVQEHRRAQKGGGASIQPTQAPVANEMSPMPPTGPLPPPVMQDPTMGLAQPAPNMMPPMPPSVPDIAQFSAGVPELPPTASALLGGPGNQMPTS